MADRDSLNGTSLAGRVHAALRDDLLSGAIPAGQRVNIATLKESYNVGLSPLREALNRLAATGLLEQRTQRGFYVPRRTQRELDDIIRLRKELEGFAVLRSVEFGDARWEAELLAAGHRLKRYDRGTDKSQAWELLHSGFHRTLLSGVGSPWTLRFIEQLHDQFDRYRRPAPFNSYLRAELNAQHEAMVSLALKRDAMAVKELVQAHIDLSSLVARESCTE